MMLIRDRAGSYAAFGKEFSSVSEDFSEKYAEFSDLFDSVSVHRRLIIPVSTGKGPDPSVAFFV